MRAFATDKIVTRATVYGSEDEAYAQETNVVLSMVYSGTDINKTTSQIETYL